MSYNSTGNFMKKHMSKAIILCQSSHPIQCQNYTHSPIIRYIYPSCNVMCQTINQRISWYQDKKVYRPYLPFMWYWTWYWTLKVTNHVVDHWPDVTNFANIKKIKKWQWPYCGCWTTTWTHCQRHCLRESKCMASRKLQRVFTVIFHKQVMVLWRDFIFTELFDLLPSLLPPNSFSSARHLCQPTRTLERWQIRDCL